MSPIPFLRSLLSSLLITALLSSLPLLIIMVVFSQPRATYSDWVAADLSGPPPIIIAGQFVVIPPEPTNVPNFTGGYWVVSNGRFIGVFPTW